MHTEELTVEFQGDAARTVLKVRGDLDLARVGRLRAALVDVCREPPGDVTVDLTEVTFLGAATVGLLVTARQLRGGGCRFLVGGLTTWQEQLLRICGPGQAITIERADAAARTPV